MKKIGLLNQPLSEVIAGLGHTDTLVIADAGLPIPAETRRIDLVVGVSYSDDIDKVKSVIRTVLSEDSRILTDPEPTVALLELGNSSVNFAVRPWVKTSDYWAVYFDTLENLKKRFDNEGICIPFPQTDVHLFQAQASA